jgi:AraC-like DNA-binding protein
MPYLRPKGILAGFMMVEPDPNVPEVVHGGEQWAPRTYDIRPHRHDVWELYFQVEGWSTWEDERGNLIRVEADGLLAMPPGLVHWLVVSPKPEAPPPVSQKHHFLFAALDVAAIVATLPQLRDAWPGTAALYASDASEAGGPFRQLVREMAVERKYRSEALRIAAQSVIVEATRQFTAHDGAVDLARRHPAVAHARELLEYQCSRPWSLHSLANAVGVSPNHLSAIFSREVGLPPRQFLLRARLRRAEALLRETDVPVTDLALELGFSSSQHFATAFKQMTGMTPSEWRAEPRGD